MHVALRSCQEPGVKAKAAPESVASSWHRLRGSDEGVEALGSRRPRVTINSWGSAGMVRIRWCSRFEIIDMKLALGCDRGSSSVCF